MGKPPDSLDPSTAPVRRVLGLMSGMSVDGLDLALVRIEGTGDHPEVVLEAHATYAYDDELREAIRGARQGSAAAVTALDFRLAEVWAADVRRFLAASGVPADAVDAIGSHGQTLHHEPRGDGRSAYTLQVGRGDVLAERTGIRTVSDFRPRDIAAGGEGAPLIPMADWILYGGDTETTACQNLGSIANVTVLPPRVQDVRAFDMGPANTLIDSFARLAGEAMDRDGALSAAGRVQDEALLSLYTLRAAWLAQPPPKSAGYGTFGPELAEAVCARHPDLGPADLAATAVAFTAQTMVEAYERFVCPRFPELRRVRCSGGGCHNPTLMAAIEQRLARAQLRVEILPAAWIDAKEAVGFALLADRTLRGLPGNVPGATGADRAVVLGVIAP